MCTFTQKELTEELAKPFWKPDSIPAGADPDRNRQKPGANIYPPTYDPSSIGLGHQSDLV